MYSEAINKFLKDKGIEVGDIVNVESRGIKEEGEVMPTLVLKLPSIFDIFFIRMAMLEFLSMPYAPMS